jgi:hypothetical protein
MVRLAEIYAEAHPSPDSESTSAFTDFRKLSSKSAIHPGVVLILPMARPEIQRRSFRVGLDYLSGRTNLINRLIEIDLCEDRAEIREFEMP